MPNDLPMFRVTGRSYAVGDSDEGVMRAASEVLPSVEDDGFARKISELAAADWTIEDADPAVIAAVSAHAPPSQTAYDQAGMGLIGGHLPELLVLLVLLAAIIAIILAVVSRYHQHLHRRM